MNTFLKYLNLFFGFLNAIYFLIGMANGNYSGAMLNLAAAIVSFTVFYSFSDID